MERKSTRKRWGKKRKEIPTQSCPSSVEEWRGQILKNLFFPHSAESDKFAGLELIWCPLLGFPMDQKDSGLLISLSTEPEQLSLFFWPAILSLLNFKIAYYSCVCDIVDHLSNMIVLHSNIFTKCHGLQSLQTCFLCFVCFCCCILMLSWQFTFFLDKRALRTDLYDVESKWWCRGFLQNRFVSTSSPIFLDLQMLFCFFLVFLPSSIWYWLLFTKIKMKKILWGYWNYSSLQFVSHYSERNNLIIVLLFIREYYTL